MTKRRPLPRLFVKRFTSISSIEIRPLLEGPFEAMVRHLACVYAIMIVLLIYSATITVSVTAGAFLRPFKLWFGHERHPSTPVNWVPHSEVGPIVAYIPER